MSLDDPNNSKQIINLENNKSIKVGKKDGNKFITKPIRAHSSLHLVVNCKNQIVDADSSPVCFDTMKKVSYLS